MIISNKQTAVEWLVDQLLKQGAMKVISNTTYYFDEKIVEQAFKMFQEQIEDAYWDGGQDIPSTGETCKQYYNETFGYHK
jgi:hypothetical protein